MAIFHLSIKPVKRSAGRSSVAAAAYRAGESLTDERTGLTHDYSKKSDVAHSELISWNGTREALWNAAEAAEKRKDACVAREYEIALPVELDAQQRLALAQRYSEWLNGEYGVAVDLCIHEKEGNPHAHILTTTRTSNSESLTDKSWREWSPQKRKKEGLSPRHDDVEFARETYAKFVNEALERAQQAARVDHRSYKRQGLDIEPSVHLGPCASALEKKGVKTRKGDENRAAKALNAAKAEVIDLQQARQRKAQAALFEKQEPELRVELARLTKFDNYAEADREHERLRDALDERREQAKRLSRKVDSLKPQGLKAAFRRLGLAKPSAAERKAQAQLAEARAGVKRASETGSKYRAELREKFKSEMPKAEQIRAVLDDPDYRLKERQRREIEAENRRNRKAERERESQIRYAAEQWGEKAADDLRAKFEREDRERDAANNPKPEPTKAASSRPRGPGM